MYNYSKYEEPNMRVFLTGATGFVGSHLVDLLLDQGHEIHALVHGESSHQPLVNHERLCPVMGDLLDALKLRNQIVSIEPDLIMHLAGQASPRQSWQKPALTFAINTGGTANVLDAAVAAGRTRTIVVTSAEIYGQINENSLPLTEDTLPDPMHPYGVSKWAAAQLVHLYWMKYGLPVIEARPLNHIGPRQALGFVVPDFASQVAEIMAGEREPLVVVGNLDVARDFTDVRDVVRAYLALAEHGKAGEAYLICSGKAVSIRVILDILLELAGVKVGIKDTVELLRPTDTPQIVGSFAKINADTGWAPIINLRQSLNDSLKEWEQKWGK
jgi:GDP-4-dehydro-6-deoxy-D-mannose reductase